MYVLARDLATSWVRKRGFDCRLMPKFVSWPPRPGSCTLPCDWSTPCAKAALNRVRSGGNSLKFQYILSSLMSPSSCLRLHPLILVHYIFPSITYYRRQFVRKLWRFVVCGMLLSSLTACNLFTFHTIHLYWPKCNSNVVANVLLVS